MDDPKAADTTEPVSPDLSASLARPSSSGLQPQSDAEHAHSTEPIKSPLGWHIMKATSVDVGIVQTLDDVREEVREIVGRERAIDALYDISIKFEDEIGADVIAAAAAS